MVGGYLEAGCFAEGLEYTGTWPISRQWSLIIATRRSGSSLGLSSETPMASTAALTMASVSSSQKILNYQKVGGRLQHRKSSEALAISCLASCPERQCSE